MQLMPPAKVLVLLIALSSSGAMAMWSPQQQTAAPLEIQLASGTPLEQRGREQLERLLAKWDLSRWLFTRTVQIQSRVIPHSHPVLTLNTQYVDNDVAQLSTFVHEQLHWFMTRDKSVVDAAIAELERLYPTAPDALPEGANGQRSTYLHLLICLLEFDALRALLGEATARETLNGFRHYTWVYREVLERPDPIRQILRTHRLDAPDARKNAER